MGCDNYVVKPLRLAVLYEKVNALIKRSKGLVRSSVLNAKTLSLNPNNGRVISDGKAVSLTPTEYIILKVLLENKGKIISRDKLIVIVWGYDSDVDRRVLDVHIRNLRKALNQNGSLIKTVVRRGYKIEDE